ncbi:YbaB/EbfC family nucleoid-associated protein [bacterium]|nr:YbaB/EbfC family nucleoid-associated protein [bacterium]
MGINSFQGGLTNLIREAKRMQVKISKLKEEFAELEFAADSGNGMVKAVVNGNLELKHIEISEDAQKEDKDMLNDLIVAAVNKAIKDAQTQKEGQMSKITSGFAVPGLF